MKRREFRLEVEGYRTNALSWGDELNDLRTGEVIHAVETFEGDVVLSADDAAFLREFLEGYKDDHGACTCGADNGSLRSSGCYIHDGLEILDSARGKS